MFVVSINCDNYCLNNVGSNQLFGTIQKYHNMGAIICLQNYIELVDELPEYNFLVDVHNICATILPKNLISTKTISISYSDNNAYYLLIRVNGVNIVNIYVGNSSDISNDKKPFINHLLKKCKSNKYPVVIAGHFDRMLLDRSINIPKTVKHFIPSDNTYGLYTLYNQLCLVHNSLSSKKPDQFDNYISEMCMNMYDIYSKMNVDASDRVSQIYLSLAEIYHMLSNKYHYDKENKNDLDTLIEHGFININSPNVHTERSRGYYGTYDWLWCNDKIQITEHGVCLESDSGVLPSDDWPLSNTAMYARFDTK